MRACVRAQIILLLRRWRARAGRARAASSLYFFRSLSHALIPLPPPPSYSDRGRDFCQLRDRFKTPSSDPEAGPVILGKNKRRGAEAVIRATAAAVAVARNCEMGGLEDDRQHNDRLGVT